MIDLTTSAGPIVTNVPWLSAAEREREARLLEHFADFWATATGSPRDIYDRFIAASPMADRTATEEVTNGEVHGWWVRPAEVPPVAGHAILFIHGGGYVLGTAKAYRGLVSQIVSRTGIPALTIDYPLAPEASLPAAPDAALRAYAYLVEQGFGRIAIIGDSAGGGLSLVTMVQLAERSDLPKPVAGVLFSPWADLAFTGKSMTDPAVTDALIGYDYLADCARKYVGAYDPRDPLASPFHGDLSGLPPLLIQVGTDERLLDDSRQVAAKAAGAGVPVELEVWEGMHHVFQLDVAQLESSREALDRAGRFITRAFGC
ncbi:acetyl esterase/lipase [Azospirillum lipoferum]|uniref:Alpha/beta hydrolase n=1 Tax=Azospirillum lipoferum TaxID=193 RepID=A0A5A9GQY9_AZOLI|nr:MULTISPECIES: alpha/beta hydrolase [Azospirillum]KAA0596024.1 alpha/beta hydrolase [Azospirillum lipoferum]MCP1610944.1 acetyl esterase/lipase [Azospirillum lipoferum]MDW5533917.1 alpha/beta hydrolase [Azospirillum sp. NL1]